MLNRSLSLPQEHGNGWTNTRDQMAFDSSLICGRQVVGAHYESVERSDFRLCTRCYQHEISTEQLTPGAHPMQRITKDAHAQVRTFEG